MSYRIKFLTMKASYFHISLIAANKRDAEKQAKDMYPNHTVVSVEAGRCSTRPTFIR